MKHAIIVANPRETSFSLSIARAYAEAAKALGGEVVLRDLYRLGFDPVLKAHELADSADFHLAPDVVAERALIADVDVFAFIYPFWFNAPPAMLKGYLDRVLGFGFGFAPGPTGNEPRLAGRRMITFSSSGAPSHWVESTGALDAVKALFDNHVAQVTGLTILDHVHFGGVTADITPIAVERNLNKIRSAMSDFFRA